MDKKHKDNNRWGSILLCAGIVGIVFISLRYLLFLLLPLGAAWILSFYLQRPFSFLTQRLRFGRGFAAVVLLGITLGLLFFVLGLAGVKLWQEAEGVGRGLSEAVHAVMKLCDGLLSRLEQMLDVTGSPLRDKLPEIAMDVMEQAATRLPALLAGAVSAVPQLAVGSVVFVLACFYFCRDFHHLNRRVLCLFDRRISRLISEFKNQLLVTCANYCKAYLFLLVLSFTQLYLGLTLLGVKYAFSLALLIAVVDILPVLGMGVVVIPWGIWCLLSGNYPLGIGLLVLFALMSVVRQVAEPKVVGDFIGLHPLVSLLCVCVGLRFLGVAGMFVVPMLVIILKNMNKSGHLRLSSGKSGENTHPL